MSIQLTEDQIEYLHNTISSARSLLDAVHCYETEEFDSLGISLHILDGHSVEEAESLYKDG